MKESATSRSCTTASVGSSSSRNSKTYELDRDVICPSILDKTNTVSSSNHDHTWSVSQNGRRLTVTRTDKPEGWDVNLSFQCCEVDLGNFQNLIYLGAGVNFIHWLKLT